MLLYVPKSSQRFPPYFSLIISSGVLILSSSISISTACEMDTRPLPRLSCRRRTSCIKRGERLTVCRSKAVALWSQEGGRCFKFRKKLNVCATEKMTPQSQLGRNRIASWMFQFGSLV